MSTTETREQIDQLIRSHGGTVRRSGTRRNYIIPTTGAMRLQVETHVRGSITTDLGMERWWCLEAPADVADQWLENNVWAATDRWVRRSGAFGATLPTGGLFSGTTVLTAEAVDVLAQWIPMELQWQKVMAERVMDR